MNNYFSSLAGITILGSVMAGSLLGCQPNNDTDTMAGSLLGCQPNNDTDTAVSKEAPVDNHVDHEQG
ncbi:hypothetical protein ACTXMH_11710, partial [Psychrobacter celer]